MTELSRGDLDGLRQAMLLGTARRPLAPPQALAPLLAAAPEADPALALLALAGQRLRFERAAVPSPEMPEAARRLHADPRPLLPASARRTLSRLVGVTDKALAPAVVPAALRRLARAGFRPHPFDLPRLLPFVQAAPESHGLAERAFIALADTPEEGRAGLAGEIDAENWTGFPKAHRRLFLGRLRRQDPAAGRTLLEGVFPSETAAMRAELLAALAVGLGPDDLPFLQTLAGDRADSVKTVAARLAARVAGTSGHAARLADAAACFRREAGAGRSILRLLGVGGEGRVTFVAPGAKPADQHGAVLRLFEGLSLPALCAQAGLDIGALLAALPEDDVVFWALHATAVEEADATSLSALTERRLGQGQAYPSAFVLTRLAAHAPAPLSAGAARALLQGAAWQVLLQHYRAAETPAQLKDDGRLVLTAALLPASALPAFLEAIAPLQAGTTRAARALAEFVAGIDS